MANLTVGEEQSWFETPSWMVLEEAMRKKCTGTGEVRSLMFPDFEVKAHNMGAFKNVEANRCSATKTLALIH